MTETVVNIKTCVIGGLPLGGFRPINLVHIRVPYINHLTKKKIKNKITMYTFFYLYTPLGGLVDPPLTR